MTDTFGRDLVIGFAELLAANGHGSWYPPPGRTYGANETAIWVFSAPDLPDRHIVLAPWTIADNPDDAMSLQGLQVRTRWAGANPLDVIDLDDGIFDTLHNRTNFTLTTGVRIAQCLRRSSASLGQDSGRRWSWSSNYYLDVHRPAPNRT